MENYKVSSVEVFLKQVDIHFLHNHKFSGLNFVILMKEREVEVSGSTKHGYRQLHFTEEYHVFDTDMMLAIHYLMYVVCTKVTDTHMEAN